MNKDLIGKRILVGPVDIAGIGSRIAAGLAEGGANVVFFNAQNHMFNPSTIEGPRLKRLFRRGMATASGLRQKGVPGTIAGVILTNCIKILAFSVACFWAEVCVFIGGKGILTHSAEYVLLRLLGKRVIHMFVGTASRPRYMSGHARDLLLDGNVDEKKLHKLAHRTRRQARRVQGIARRASVVIENPLCGQFHDKPFVNYFKIGTPLDVSQIEQKSRPVERFPDRSEGKLAILHCPSHPEIKGSFQIQAVVNRLISEGLPIDYRQLTGIPHSQVLREITQCDLVIDQLFSDTQMAAFAAEASALGKPTVVGGYGWKLIVQDLETTEIPPTTVCHPDHLETTIRKLINPELRKRAGSEARQFLIEQWSGVMFTNRLARLVSGDIPREWWIEPHQVCYMHGCGIEENEVRRIIGAMVARFGPGALQVNHNSDLRDQMVAFAKGQKASYL